MQALILIDLTCRDEAAAEAVLRQLAKDLADLPGLQRLVQQHGEFAFVGSRVVMPDNT